MCAATITAQKMKFPIKDFFRKCDQIRWKLRIWSRLLKKPLKENFIFCALYNFLSRESNDTDDKDNNIGNHNQNPY